VDADYVSKVEPEFARLVGRGVALAAPEVSLEARLRLLQLGHQYGFLKTAAFTSAEMQPAVHMGHLPLVDLLSLNLDEAAALLGCSAEEHPPQAIVESALQRLQMLNPKMQIAITAGKNGSWAWDGTRLTHAPAYPVQVASSAGAGDAFLAALIVGTVAGLSWSQAQELASLTAALSVTSPHTIHPGLERNSLRAFADQLGAPLSDAVRALLGSVLDCAEIK
jgi:ribokinase